MKSKPQSNKKAIVSFAIGAVGAVLAALDLHGWHMYLMLGVTVAVATIAAVFLARKLRGQSSASSE